MRINRKDFRTDWALQCRVGAKIQVSLGVKFEMLKHAKN